MQNCGATETSETPFLGLDRKRRRRITGVLLIVGLDQLTKAAAILHLPPAGIHEFPVIPGFLSFVHVRNTGAAWGMFQGAPLLLGLISAAVLTYIVVRFDSLCAGSIGREAALILLAGGIGGNLVDRIARGAVVDFVLVYYRSFHWPAFNLADSAITCGVILYVGSSVLERR